jgi:hypothetical protein
MLVWTRLWKCLRIYKTLTSETHKTPTKTSLSVHADLNPNRMDVATQAAHTNTNSLNEHLYHPRKGKVVPHQAVTTNEMPPRRVRRKNLPLDKRHLKIPPKMLTQRSVGEWSPLQNLPD